MIIHISLAADFRVIQCLRYIKLLYLDGIWSRVSDNEQASGTCTSYPTLSTWLASSVVLFPAEVVIMPRW